MAFIYPLCSSSSGNATYVGDEKNGVLIDAGLSLRALKRSLAFASVDLSAVKAIFVTHEHTDHIKGIKAISQATSAPVFASDKTLSCLLHNGYIAQSIKSKDVLSSSYNQNGIEVTAFKTPHDSVCSVGYKIRFENGKTACVCTDLGCVTDEVYQNLVSSDVVLLESNYDETMLVNGGYPAFLKKRIASSNGHLSNEICASTLIDLFNDGTTKFILGHLSENNNRPEIAFKTAVAALIKTGGILERDFSLSIARKQAIGETVYI